MSRRKETRFSVGGLIFFALLVTGTMIEAGANRQGAIDAGIFLGVVAFFAILIVLVRRLERRVPTTPRRGLGATRLCYVPSEAEYTMGCVQCGREADGNASGWRPLGDAEWEEEERLVVTAQCLECARLAAPVDPWIAARRAPP